MTTIFTHKTSPIIDNETTGKESLEAKAIYAINSLGGKPLHFGQNPDHAKVTLANYAACDLQPWQLDVMTQRLLQKTATAQGFRISA